MKADSSTLRLVLGALALGALGALAVRRGEDIRTAALLASLRRLRPAKLFDACPLVPAPDYARPESWAALPGRLDLADVVPPGLEQADDQFEAAADVFFVHPTTLLSPASWNGPVDDPVLNLATDQGSIKHQTSVYAPAIGRRRSTPFWTRRVTARRRWTWPTRT